jgi:hypothetical protein
MSIPIGTMLFAPGTALPPDWVTEPAPRADGWSSVAQSATPLLREQRLAATGWTFAFRAPALATIAYGFNQSTMFTTAMARLQSDVLRHGCNAVEIDSVSNHNFLGFPYLRITAHPRDLRHENPR